MKVLVIQHETLGPAGAFRTYLETSCNANIRTVSGCDLNVTIPLNSYDLYVVLGSEMSTNDVAPAWIPREIDFIKKLLASERPVIGICFGAQAIARAAGGSVGRMDHWRYGWIANDETSSEVWEGPWFNWHNETIQLPEQADLLASSNGTVQAFQVGNAVGVQFHPEVTKAILRTWPEREGYCFETGFRDETLESRTHALFSEMLRLANPNGI